MSALAFVAVALAACGVDGAKTLECQVQLPADIPQTSDIVLRLEDATVPGSGALAQTRRLVGSGWEWPGGYLHRSVALPYEPDRIMANRAYVLTAEVVCNGAVLATGATDPVRPDADGLKTLEVRVWWTSENAEFEFGTFRRR